MVPRTRGELLNFLIDTRSHLDTSIKVYLTDEPVTPYYDRTINKVAIPSWFLADNATAYSLNSAVADRDQLGKNVLATTLLSAGLVYADVRRLKSTHTLFDGQFKSALNMADNGTNAKLLNKLVYLIEDINLEHKRTGEFGAKFVEFFNEWLFGGLMTGFKWSRVEQATNKKELLHYLLSYLDSFRAPTARNHTTWQNIPDIQAILAKSVGSDNITRQRCAVDLYEAIKDLLNDPPPACQCSNEKEEQSQAGESTKQDQSGTSDNQDQSDTGDPIEDYTNQSQAYQMGDLDIGPEETNNFTPEEIYEFVDYLNNPEPHETTIKPVTSYHKDNDTINYVDITPHGSIERDKQFDHVAQIIQMLRAKQHEFKGLSNNGGLISEDDLWRIGVDGFIFEPPNEKKQRTHRTIVVLVDLSSSIGGSIGQKRLAKAVYGLSDSLRKNGERIYVLGFSNEYQGVMIYRILKPGQANLSGRFNTLAHVGGGSTPEAHGLLAAIRQLANENGEKMIIVINDGMPNVPLQGDEGDTQKSVQRMIKLAHKNKIKTMYVSLTKAIVSRNDDLCGANNNVHGYDGKLESSLQELIMRWETEDKA